MRFAGFDITTAPTTEPVTVAQVKEQWNQMCDVDDDKITFLIKVARDFLENYLHMAFMPQTITMKMDCWKTVIRPVRPPLTLVSGIQYKDANGDTQTFSSSGYIVDTITKPGRISLASGYSYPSIINELGAINIVYVAGYADADSVPPAIKQTIISLVIAMLEHPEQDSEIVLSENPSLKYVKNMYKITEFD